MAMKVISVVTETMLLYSVQFLQHRGMSYARFQVATVTALPEFSLRDACFLIYAFKNIVSVCHRCDISLKSPSPLLAHVACSHSA